MIQNSKIYKIISGISVATALTLTMTGCGHKDEPKEEDEKVERVTVVYAVNRSSLASNFIDDSAEMLVAMDKINSMTDKLLVYKTDSSESTGLYETYKVNGQWNWNLVKEYKRTVTATDPDRMAEVLEDACYLYDNVQRTLIFWGHGTSWKPEFSDHNPGVRSAQTEYVRDYPLVYAYGGEHGAKTDWVDLADMAEAIPSGKFDTIWFDCCLMSNIEVAYQLRDKASWLVAYPTEVWDAGMDYSTVLPLLMKKNRNLTVAAESFFNNYALNHEAVTVSVMDLSKIDKVADAVSKIVARYGDAVSCAGYISDYGRYSNSGNYDLVQLFSHRINTSGKEADTQLMDGLKKAMSEFVVYHKEYGRDFNNRPWVDSDLCGVSGHNYGGGSSKADQYYTTLDWYKRVY